MNFENPVIHMVPGTLLIAEGILIFMLTLADMWVGMGIFIVFIAVFITAGMYWRRTAE